MDDLKGRASSNLLLCLVTAAAALMIFGISCNGADPSGTAALHHGLVVSSVRPCWEQAVQLAEEWQPDARIVQVETTAKVPEGMPHSYAVIYRVQSPSEEYQTFFISCKYDGARTGTIDHKEGWPVDLWPPLAPEDFTIDSQRALDIAMQNGDSRMALSSNSFVDLYLSRSVPWYLGRAIWRVTFSIGTIDSTYIYIDANTGEVLEIT
jgi:hypothetical protein